MKEEIKAGEQIPDNWYKEPHDEPKKFEDDREPEEKEDR